MRRRRSARSPVATAATSRWPRRRCVKSRLVHRSGGPRATASSTSWRRTSPQLLVALDGRAWENGGRDKGTAARSAARGSPSVEMAALAAPARGARAPQHRLSADEHRLPRHLLRARPSRRGAARASSARSALVLGLYALSVLPVNLAGVGLILLALVFFIAEIKVTSYGLLAVGGIIALVLGSLLLFRDLRSGVATRRWRPHRRDRHHGCAGGRLSRRSRRPRPARAGRRPGNAGLVGELGRAIGDLRPRRQGVRARRDLERRLGGSGPVGPERAGRRRRRACASGCGPRKGTAGASSSSRIPDHLVARRLRHLAPPARGSRSSRSTSAA